MKSVTRTPHAATDFLKNAFSEVPATYERVNHVLTLGLDRVLIGAGEARSI